MGEVQHFSHLHVKEIVINKELINKCLAKDRKSQSVLHEHCFHLLMPVCFKYMKQEELAREMYNQIFVKIIFSLIKYDQSKDFGKWTKTIAINSLIDEYRKSKRYKKIIDENIAIESFSSNSNEEDLINELERSEEQESVDKILQKLPPVSRRVFNLFIMEGFSHKEISKMLDMSTGTSKWHVSNARQLLKKYVMNVFQIFIF
jgi:RNA polymerase sigma factor (sigma-70 family)